MRLRSPLPFGQLLIWATLALLSWVAGSLATRANILLSEIHYHPQSEDNREEFVELFNSGDTPVDLSRWRFTSGITFVFPDRTTVPPKAYLVIAADVATFQKLHPSVTQVVGPWIGQLSNSGESIELSDAAHKVVQRVRYADEGDWARRKLDAADRGHRGWTWFTPADGQGSSLELRQPGLPNVHGQNWGPSAVPHGTPGRANSIAAADLPPMILDVAHSPVLPRSLQPIVITAAVLDEAAAPQVDVWWRRDGAPEFARLPMQRLEGVGSTAFHAELPGQTNLTIIEYYLAARDAAGLERTWPAPVEVDGKWEQRCNALLMVDDTVLPESDPPLPHYRLIFTAADRAELASIVRSDFSTAQSHAEFNATFIAIEKDRADVRYQTGVRNRGNGSAARPPGNFRVNFRHDDFWRGLQALNFNSQFTPVQYLGSVLYRLAGLPAAGARPVRLRVNRETVSDLSTASYGFYVASEVIDSDFAARAYPQDSSGNVYRGIRLSGRGADLSYRGDDPDDYRANYFKRTNTSEDDWSDLIQLARTLEKAPDESYLEEVEKVADIDAWLIYFAVETIVDNKETNLGNANNGSGQGDDYFLYFGARDRRARIIPYDLDTILGLGDSSFNAEDGLFRMNANPVLERFMTHPVIAQKYYRTLDRLLNSVFLPAQLTNTVAQILGPLVESRTRDLIQTFHARRHAFLLAQIPNQLSATNTSVEFSQGAYQTSSRDFDLAGRADPRSTASVRVNGVPAEWTVWTARWKSDRLPLLPGWNAVLVQTFDKSGRELQRTAVPVFRRGTPGVEWTGALTKNTVMRAADSPHRIRQTLRVPAGMKLTLEAGATLQFAPQAGLVVEGDVEGIGTELARIHLTPLNPESPTWAGVLVNHPEGASVRFEHTDWRGAGALGYNLRCAHATLHLDHCRFLDSKSQYIDLLNTRFHIRACEFPSIPNVEMIHGRALPADGFGIIEECWFGAVSGPNDTIDFTGGKRPGAILEIIRNVFTETGDDFLDLDGTDAHIEDNVFLQTTQTVSAVDSSSAISAGADGGIPSEITLARNFFYRCENLALLKEGSVFTLENNTALSLSKSVLLFDEPGRRAEGVFPGKGARVQGNLFWLAPTNFAATVDADSPWGATELTAHHNLLPAADAPRSASLSNNLSLDPRLRDSRNVTASTIRTALQPRRGSPALGAGPAGADLGAAVPQGLHLSGLPQGATRNSRVTVAAAGPGQVAWRWRVNGGAWSNPAPLPATLVLENLPAGRITFEALAQNSAGRWQPEASATSHSWTLNPQFQQLQLTEVYAPSSKLEPDWFELHNDSDSPLSLDGYRIGSGINDSKPFQFRPNTQLAPNQRRTFAALDLEDPLNPARTWTLSASGDRLVIFDPQQRVVDDFSFGFQTPGYSLGRTPDGSASPWSLCHPTPGQANLPARVADPDSLQLSELLALPSDARSAAFLELFNPDSLPIDLSGVRWTAQPDVPARGWIFPPHTYLGAGAARVFSESQLDSYALTPNPHGGVFSLFHPSGTLLDSVAYGPQRPGRSEGRHSGTSDWKPLPIPTPGQPNPPPPPPPPGGAVVRIELPLVSFTNRWRFSQSGPPNADWFSPPFIDSDWAEGNAGFLAGGGAFSVPIRTALNLGQITYYFRTQFATPQLPPGARIELRHLIDDGAIIRLNGAELSRIRMPEGPITHATLASQRITGALVEGPLPVQTSLLAPTSNTLAVEVHQQSADSGDLTFALELLLVYTQTNSPPVSQLHPPKLNEIFVHNASLRETDGSLSDGVELFNPNTVPYPLADLSLTDSLQNPRKFVFPAHAQIPPLGFLWVRCHPPSPIDELSPQPVPAELTSAFIAPFGLKKTGDSVYLVGRVAEGAPVLDGIEFGLQIADLSIARFQRPNGDDSWELALPSPGQTNRLATLHPDPSALRINEWLANPISGDDWLELFNPAPFPIRLDGLALTDDPANLRKSVLPPLSFIGAQKHGYVQLIADGNPARGAQHLDFKLAARAGRIGLYDRDGREIDVRIYDAQSSGVTEGRLPDGSTTVVRFPTLPTPGAPNQADTDLDGMSDDWELQHGLDPQSPHDGPLDPDGDGSPNSVEFRAGTDPRTAASVLALEAKRDPNGAWALEFRAEPGIAYQLDSRSNLATEDWSAWTRVDAKDVVRRLRIVIEPSESARFYRIGVVP